MWSDIATIITNSRYYGRVKSEGKLKEDEELLQEYQKYYKEVSEFIPIAINNIAVDALKLGKDEAGVFQKCTGEEVYEDYLHFKKKAEFLKKNNKYLFKENSGGLRT